MDAASATATSDLHPSASPALALHALAQLVNASHDGILALDRRHRVTFWNRAMERMTGIFATDALGRDPFVGDLFVFRGARGDLIKILWHDGLGLSLYAKRLERGRFVWPPSLPSPSASLRSPEENAISISAAQLAYLLSGIDWRNPVHTFRPERAG